MPLFVLIIVHVLTAALGWSSDSHKIVARVAAKHIQRKTRRFVREHIPPKDGSWMGLSESALVQVSAWADQVLENPAYAWSRELHFSDTPYRACDAYDEARDCGRGSGRCIVTAIANYTERAANIALPHEQRAEAIKFLVHLVADAHSGLHVGFSEDAGGNAIHLRNPDMSLHEVWDSLLLDTFRASLAVGSWVRVSTELIAMISGSRELVADAKLTPEQLETAGEAIVTETATRVTCASAYSHNGAWIHSGDSLDDEYVVDRAGVAIDRLIKAGLRLAQVLDAVAASYYYQERMAEAVRLVSPAARVDTNPFSCLAFDFDPEEWVFELTVDEHAEAAERDDEEGDAVPVTTTQLPTTVRSAEERRAAKRKSEKARAKLNKRKIDGVDIGSLVLIKRRHKFYITSRKLVESEEWMPSLFSIVTAKFADSDTPLVFLFDSAVFGVAAVSHAVQEATFRHLRGLEALPASGAGTFESTTVGEKRTVHPLMAAMRSVLPDGAGDPKGLDGLSWNPFGAAPYSSVTDYVRAPIPARRLRELYGGTLPSDSQRQVDLLNSEADDIVRINFGKVRFIARARDLADHSQKRWVFNEYNIIDSSVSLTDSLMLLVDARLMDEALTAAGGELLSEITNRAKNRQKTRQICKRIPPILKRMYLLNEYYVSGQNPLMALHLVVAFERMTTIERTDGGQFLTLEYVLRDEAGMRSTREALGIELPDVAAPTANPLR